jgi:hypothetical protein
MPTIYALDIIFVEVQKYILFYADFYVRIETRITTEYFNAIFDKNSFICTYFLIIAVRHLDWQHMTK